MAFSDLQLPGKAFRRSDSDNPKLRVGLLLDGPRMTAWSKAVVQDLLLSDFVEVLDVQLHNFPRWPSTSFSGAISKFLFRSLDWLYRVVSDPLALLPVPPSLQDRKDSGELDVLLDLTTSGVDAWRPAKFGCWRLQMGRYKNHDAWPPFAREILTGESLRRVELHQCFMHVEEPSVLCMADFPAAPYPSSRSNVVGPLWGSSHFFIQKLHELHTTGSVEAINRPGSAMQIMPALPLRSRDVLRWVLEQGSKRIRRRFQVPSAGTVWRIAIRRTSVPLPELPTEEALRSFRWLEEMGTASVADPFLFEEGGTLWLFFEEIDKQSGHGRIACCSLDNDGRIRDARTVLSASTHLSYPHVFRVADEIYMLPESAESGGLDLYRALRFPDEWERVCRILDFPCVDSTAFHKDGEWWMFTSPMAISGAVALTWLFKADKLTGPWKFQHTGVVSATALNARAAGEVLARDGRILRPSQDCGLTYGRAIVFNEVTSLDGPGFEEHPYSRVESKPFPGLVGLHTYNQLREWEVIDGLFRVDS